MNILILNWRDPGHPNAGGAEEVTLEHAKGWISAGHKVYWFSSSFSGGDNKSVIAGVKIIRSGRQFIDVQARAFLWYFFGKHPDFSLVVDQFHGIPFFTPLYIGTKKLAFIHEVAKEVWRLNAWPKPFNLIPAFFGPFFEKWVFKLFYKKTPFMTVSESTRKDLIEWGIPKENITVIHNGVKLDLPKLLPAKEKRKTAMFLGVISKDKGIEDAIKCFSEISKKEADWQFWVVGKSSDLYIKKIEWWINQLGIRENFKYWGYVPEKKKFELLARTHVLINPSVREGWGLVNIEANAVGVPVIAYNVSGVRDSVVDGKTGILCMKSSPKSLATNAVDLVGDVRRYRRLSKNAKRWSRKFKWSELSKESLLMISDLIKKPS